MSVLGTQTLAGVTGAPELRQVTVVTVWVEPVCDGEHHSPLPNTIAAVSSLRETTSPHILASNTTISIFGFLYLVYIT